MKILRNKQAMLKKIIDRGIVVDILPTMKEFIKVASNKTLRFYIGADPTSNSLHLSHAKNYMLLEEFRQLGHEVIVLFGDFTAMIGDPSDRSSTRARLTHEQIMQHVKDWKKQIQPLMNFKDSVNPPKIMFNSKWLNKLSMVDVINLMSNVTVQRMLERDMFVKRMKDQKPIALHEFIYPLMQGYDSVAMDVDVELCGTDQRFNALMGRTLQRKLKNKEKFVVIVNLMENPKTGELMSKSKGTGVFLDVVPKDMFGQIMSLPDEMTKIVLINNTRIPIQEIDFIIKGHPRDAKLRAAFEITALFHGRKSAIQAQNEFILQFQQQKTPLDLPLVNFHSNSATAFAIVRECINKKVSNSQINRLFTQGAIKADDQVIKDRNHNLVIPESGLVLKVGKRDFFKVVAVV